VFFVELSTFPAPVPPSSPTASRREHPTLCLQGMVQPHARPGQEATRQGVPRKTMAIFVGKPGDFMGFNWEKW